MAQDGAGAQRGADVGGRLVLVWALGRQSKGKADAVSPPEVEVTIRWSER